MVPRAGGWLVCPRGMLGAATLVWLAACGGGSSPAPPSGGTPPDVPSGAIPVNGSERLWWDQEGDVAQLRFQAYVDGVPARLDAATCDAAAPGPQGFPCVSPLPPLADGLHKIALTAVSRVTGLESAQSESVTVYKLPVGATGSNVSFESGNSARLAVGPLDETVNTSGGLGFSVCVVATGLEAPTELAAAPDGRLFVAEATGRVLVLRIAACGAARLSDVVDTGVTLGLAPASTPGLALHPDFLSNHFVYIGYVFVGPDGQTHLRIVRMREVDGTLREAVVLFEEEVVAVPGAGLRLAFGPDGHLYVVVSHGVALPTGNGRGRAGGVILRLADGRRAANRRGVFAFGVDGPYALAWHPDTGAPWAVLADSDGRAALREIETGDDFGAARAPSAPPHIDVGRASAPGGFVFLRSGATEPSTLLVALPDNESLWLVRLGEATTTEPLLPYVLGRVGSIAQDADGTVFIATRNRDGVGTVAAGDDLIVRLTPRVRSR